MKLTKGIITRDEAFRLAPDFVRYNEATEVFSSLFEQVHEQEKALKKGQAAITFYRAEDGQKIYVRVKAMVDHDDWRAEDGPIIRVGNGEYTWRVDGNGGAYPISKECR